VRIRAAEVAIVREEESDRGSPVQTESASSSQIAVAGLKESLKVTRESVVSGFRLKVSTCRPVNANGRLARAVGARAGRSEALA